MKRIEVDEDVNHFLASKAVDIGESASSILRRELHLPASSTAAFDIDDDVYAFLVSRMATIGESASSILRRELHIPPADGGTPGSGGGANPGTGGGSGGGTGTGTTPHLVEFHIAAGTGAGPWNTVSTRVDAVVGDTLRLINNDTVSHRLHTDGTAPFSHPAFDLGPGQSVDTVLAMPFDGVLHDHDFGDSAQFFIRVRSAT